jgi:hypothetical protein
MCAGFFVLSAAVLTLLNKYATVRPLKRNDRIRRKSALTNRRVPFWDESNSGVTMSEELILTRGQANVIMAGHVINCDATPFIPNGWTLASEHDQISSRVRGKVSWDAAKFGQVVSKKQTTGWVRGTGLYKSLLGEPVLPANCLDYLLANQELIPNSLRGKALVFWGTIYRNDNGLPVVRCMCWNRTRWHWDHDWLGNKFTSRSPATVLLTS